MPIKRFVFFWILNYVISVAVIFTLSSASTTVFGQPQLRYISLLFIPISTMFFSWMFYRRAQRMEFHRLMVAGLWVGLAIFIDALVYVLMYHLSPFIGLTSPISLAAYGAEFLAVFVGAYLGMRATSQVVVADDMLSPR